MVVEKLLGMVLKDACGGKRRKVLRRERGDRDEGG